MIYGVRIHENYVLRKGVILIHVPDIPAFAVLDPLSDDVSAEEIITALTKRAPNQEEKEKT